MGRCRPSLLPLILPMLVCRNTRTVDLIGALVAVIVDAAEDVVETGNLGVVGGVVSSKNAEALGDGVAHKRADGVATEMIGNEVESGMENIVNGTISRKMREKNVNAKLQDTRRNEKWRLS